MRLGSLCTGYGGLDMAVEAVTGAELAWTSDIDKGANKIIAHRYGHVPNIGDMTTVLWGQLADEHPVDILTGGYPCQPFSGAGRRKGHDDERNLWPHVRAAIRALRPRLTVLENVAGHRSMGFDRVLGDLAEDGMHVRWTSLRAADVGAPHGRERLFIVVTDPRSEHGSEWWELAAREAEARRTFGEPAGRNRAPLDLLPTPRGSDGEKGGPNQRGSSGDLMLPSAVLLGTPRASEYKGCGPVGSSSQQHWLEHDYLSAQVIDESFGKYTPAIVRWERIMGRYSPWPTEPTGRNDAHRLSPAFVEFLMGLPEGWVTDVPDLTRNEALKALGNGVVPQQAEAALRMLLGTAVAA